MNKGEYETKIIEKLVKKLDSKNITYMYVGKAGMATNGTAGDLLVLLSWLISSLKEQGNVPEEGIKNAVETALLPSEELNKRALEKLKKEGLNLTEMFDEYEKWVNKDE